MQKSPGHRPYPNLAWPLLVACVFLASACGGSAGDEPTGAPETPAVDPPGTSQPPPVDPNPVDPPKEPTLECATIAWCSSGYFPARNLPQPPPAWNGGTIQDGVYRNEEGSGLVMLDALAFNGSTVVGLRATNHNEQGTFMTEGNTLTLSFTAECAGNPAAIEGNPLGVERYRFTVAGDDLFIARIYDTGPGEPSRLRRVTSLCSTSSSYRCDNGGRPCACNEQVGKGMLPTCER